MPPRRRASCVRLALRDPAPLHVIGPIGYRITVASEGGESPKLWKPKSMWSLPEPVRPG